jgi:hypothetical protein
MVGQSPFDRLRVARNIETHDHFAILSFRHGEPVEPWRTRGAGRNLVMVSRTMTTCDAAPSFDCAHCVRFAQDDKTWEAIAGNHFVMVRLSNHDVREAQDVNLSW